MLKFTFKKGNTWDFGITVSRHNTTNVISLAEVKLSGFSFPFDELFVLLQLIGTAVWKFRLWKDDD